MFEAKAMLYLYVETPLHAGSGTSLGVVDLPIQRERVTNYPMVQSSGIKGKLRAEAGDDPNKTKDTEWEKKVDIVFGPEAKSGIPPTHAGAFSPSDARLLLFPMRSLLGVFAWVTSHDALARFYRDAKTIGLPLKQDNKEWKPIGPSTNDMAYVSPASDCDVTATVGSGEQLVLEEFAFNATSDATARTETQRIAKWLV